MLFIPYAVDAHPDHVAAAQIAMAARFYSKFTKTTMAGEPYYPPLVFRYMAVHLRVIATPSFVVECGGYLDAKVRALQAYHSQFGANPANAGIVDAMVDAARVWGGFARVEAAEPFFALEPIALEAPDVVL
jgi:LmbE family N-acetylglucosaminyl deacetylase